MSPKTALKILLAIVIIIAILFLGLYIKKQLDLKREAREAMKIENIINKKKQQGELTAPEQEKLDAFIEEKVEVKRQELDEKTDEEIKSQGYTQEEVDFILDPKRTIEKELGIEEEGRSEPLTQEEIDAILNP